MNSPEPLTPAVLGLSPSAEADFAVYNWYTKTLLPLSAAAKASLDAGYEGHAYAAVYPILNGQIFLGECDKYIPASTLRFSSVNIDAQHVKASVVALAGENITLCAARASDWIVHCSIFAFDAEGTRTIVLI